MEHATQTLATALAGALEIAARTGSPAFVIGAAPMNGGTWYVPTWHPIRDVTKEMISDAFGDKPTIDSFGLTCVVDTKPVDRYLIHEPTGSVYHRHGSNICAHAMGADGTFSPDCLTDAALIEDAGQPESELVALLTKTFGDWNLA